jgi:hypothetical protein
MKDRLRVKGLVTVRVLDREGNVKRRPQTWFHRLLHILGRPKVMGRCLKYMINAGCMSGVNTTQAKPERRKHEHSGI